MLVVFFCVSKNVSVSCAYTQGKREQFSGFNRTLDAINNVFLAPLPPETELSRQMTTSTTSIDIMGLQAAYANLHTDQERDYFMQRYHDVISSFGGKTSYDADNRPLLVMRSNLWASGYDVDGTDQTSLGQFSGRVQQTYKHSVPRFFVPEH